MANPLLDLHSHGQSVWYDNIERGLIMSGELYRLIHEDGVRGLTSNPAIFEKAISGSNHYAGTLGALAHSGRSAQEIYEAIAIEDIQWVADLLLPVYQDSQGRDGYVSLEVSPHLANDTPATIEEALRLSSEVARPNLMIKVPGTPAGVPAVEQLIGQGININITLLFSRENYEKVVEAYICGVEQLDSRGGDLSGIASVASFFISRIDTLADELIQQTLQQIADSEGQKKLDKLLGKTAIANAKLAYATYREAFGGECWQRLAEKGARTQRLLWASTSTKNPAYRDVLYVEELIGRDTVNTMPEATVNAFRDHGIAESTLDRGLDEAKGVMLGLEAAGISMKEVTDQLQTDAVRLFAEPFDKLLASIEAQRDIAKRA